MNRPAPQADPFAQRLGALLRRGRVWLLGHGVLRFAAVGGAMVLAAAWAVGGETGPGAFNGWGLTVSLGLGLAALAWRLLLRPWRWLRTSAGLARLIERRADFANLVVAAEEARRLPERWPTTSPVARELRRRLDERAASVLDLVTPADVLPMRRTRLAGLGLVVVVGVAALLAGTRPAEMTRGLGRLAAPGPDEAAELSGGLFALAQGAGVVAGDTAELVGVDFADGEGAATVQVRVGTGAWQDVATRPDPLPDIAPGLPQPCGRWSASLTEVREDFAWRIRRGARSSAAREVAVRQHPLLADLAATVVPPSYTRLPARDLPRLPAWIEVPAGSTVELRGRTSLPVEDARLALAGGDTVALAVDSLAVAGSLSATRDRRFRVLLRDAWGLTNTSPLLHEIAAAADQAPAVSLERPDDDGILPLSGEVALLVEAADDYGLARLAVLVRTGAAVPLASGAGETWLGGAFWGEGAADIDRSAWRLLETAAGPLRVRALRVDEGAAGLRARFRLELRTDGLDLVAGDALELLVEAEDNRRPRPANVSRSRTLRLQLPAAAEVLVSQSESNARRRDELEEMRRRSTELNADLDRLTRELMKNPIPDWSRQQEMESAIERQKTLQDELARVAEELRRELQKLAESQLTNESQLRKADEMSELLQPGQSEQLQDLLQQMSEGEGGATPEDVSRAMEEVARNQQDMARRLDAALAMLKRMAQEQELAGLTALLEQLIQKQQELADLSRELAERQEAEGEGESPEGDSEGGESSGEQDQAEGESGESGEQNEQGSEGEQGENAEGESPSGETDPAAPQPSAEELARRQEALKEELAQLQEKLEEALENLREQNAQDPRESTEQMAEAMEQALENMKSQQNQDAMGQAGEQLEQMDPEQAAKLQEQALRNLGSLYSVLLESQQAMQQAMEMEQVGNLRDLAADVLALSARQEEIVQRVPARLRDLRSRELTRSQHRVQRSVAGVREGLGQLMDTAPNRIMKLMGQFDGLIETMGESVQAMEDNRAPVARRHARDALAEANQIVIGLLTEAQMQSSSGGGGGGSPQQSLAEKLQQMAREQAGLNGITEELRRMLADRGISQEARSRMERLGQQQAEMAQRMGELAEEERERPEGERLLGDLSELGRNMERVGRDLGGGLVDEETLVRQERILSRMLDARNSVRRRDYNNRREGETAETLFGLQQGGPEDGTGGDDDPFRLRYQPLEKAPMEYRDLVRRYFAALDSLGRGDLADTEPETGEVP